MTGTAPMLRSTCFAETTSEKILVKDGMILYPERIYNVASSDYLVGHAEDKYLGFKIDETRDTGFFLDQALLEWMEKKGWLDYKHEGRIIEKHSHSSRQ